jgi:Probable sensor domain DACNV
MGCAPPRIGHTESMPETLRFYPAARLVAPRIHEHFAAHLEAARGRGAVSEACLPDVAAIEEIIDAAFWASLRREEDYVPRISLAFLPPGDTAHTLTFEHGLPLDATALTRVSPAVERAGIHLGVWRLDGDLRVWGATRTIPALCFVVEVAAPGLLVVKHHWGDDTGKFVNVAVLEGDQIKVVDERATSLPECPDLLASLHGFDSPSSWVESLNVPVQLAVSMRAHGRGGLLLVVPAGSDAWRDSIVRPIAYGLDPPYTRLAGLMAADPAARRDRQWRDALDRNVDAIAGLTAVDGAAVMTDRYELLAFGAKIMRRKGGWPVERVAVTEPIEGSVAAVVPPTQLGGTRHLSAAQFIQDQRDGLAMVASQDGRFTVFAWSPCDETVHAHRVDTLLL